MSNNTNSRRSFLKFLGIAGAAAPVVVATVQAANAPIPAVDPDVSERDPFHIPPEIVPRGKVYQWKRSRLLDEPDAKYLMELKAKGWATVPAKRHDGLFMPKGWWGAIEVGGLMLMEKAAW